MWAIREPKPAISNNNALPNSVWPSIGTARCRTWYSVLAVMLLLVESVTSHGPVDAKRHNELAELFDGATPGLVYVTAFPNRVVMGKYLRDISWETEVWCADAPTHLIHFDGKRFLGPYEGNEQ